MNKLVNGMTLLDRYKWFDIHELTVALMIIGIVLIFGFGYRFTIASIISESKENIWNYLGLMVLGLILLILPFYVNCKLYEGIYRYEITLKRDISARYIEENFKIIDVKDGIWTLEVDESG